MAPRKKKITETDIINALIAPHVNREEAPIVEMALETVATETPPATEATVEEAVARLEAIEEITPTPHVPEGWTSVEDGTEEAPADVPQTANSFDEVVKAIGDDVALEMATKTAAQFDERAEFERVKDPTNVNIHRTLKKARGEMTTLRAAKVMIAANIDPSVFNRTIHEGARYNVYAIGKLGDAVKGLTDGVVRNAINVACMRSLFRFKAAGMTFTGEMAKCAASDKIRIERAIAEHLVRHTVAASTAPTQASSTMQALETLGIVTRTGSGKNPTFVLRDAPIVDRLKEVLAA